METPQQQQQQQQQQQTTAVVEDANNTTNATNAAAAMTPSKVDLRSSAGIANTNANLSSSSLSSSQSLTSSSASASDANTTNSQTSSHSIFPMTYSPFVTTPTTEPTTSSTTTLHQTPQDAENHHLRLPTAKLEHHRRQASVDTQARLSITDLLAGPDDYFSLEQPPTTRLCNTLSQSKSNLLLEEAALEEPTLHTEKSDDYQFNIERHLAKQSLKGELDHAARETLSKLTGVALAFTRWKSMLKKKQQQTEARIPKTGYEALSTTPPFTYLNAKQKEEIASQLQERHYKDMEQIYAEGEGDRTVYLLANGQVVGASQHKTMRSQDEASPPNGVREVFLSAPAVFGAHEAIIEEKRSMSFYAVGSVGANIWVMPSKTFDKVLEMCAPVRYALGKDLKSNKKLFRALEGFSNLISNSIASGSRRIDFDQLLKRYRTMRPALHPGIHSPEIDTGAWMYAIRRLPANITQVYLFMITTQVPATFLHPDLNLRKIVTAGRRRLIFALSPGKNLVLIREDESDILDFLSCLCLHAIEAEKLRRRLTAAGPWVSRLLHDFILRHDSVTEISEHDLTSQAEVLNKLPLSEDERVGLAKIWACDVLKRIWEMMLLHEDYSISLDLPPTYQIDSLERWVEEIRTAAAKLMDITPDQLCTVDVDLISSNTHSVINCCSPWLHSNKEKILKWSEENFPEVFMLSFYNPTDLLYSAVYRYFKANPHEAVACQIEDAKHGIMTLFETELTGIQVNLIDLSKLDPKHIDPSLLGYDTEKMKKSRRLLINIDYAFGKQAEHIISSLIYLCGPTLRSVNVLGKAGGFQGQRGDIILTSHLIMQDTEDIICINNEGLSEASLKQLSGRDVWSGGVLTVRGTLLQDRGLLLYFKKLWGCVALEMEGSYYARKLSKYRELKFLRNDVATRFLYYTSDLPLNSSANLSTSLSLQEGVPPLYATTRAFLQQILNSNYTSE